MKEIVIRIEVPENLKINEEMIRRRLEEEGSRIIREEIIVEFLNEVAKGAKELDEREILELADKIKEGEVERLKREGLL